MCLQYKPADSGTLKGKKLIANPIIFDSDGTLFESPVREHGIKSIAPTDRRRLSASAPQLLSTVS
jgi:hypothetical protein